MRDVAAKPVIIARIDYTLFALEVGTAIRKMFGKVIGFTKDSGPRAVRAACPKLVENFTDLAEAIR